MDHRARLRAERQAKSAARFHFSSVDLALRGAHSSHFGRPAGLPPNPSGGSPSLCRVSSEGRGCPPRSLEPKRADSVPGVSGGHARPSPAGQTPVPEVDSERGRARTAWAEVAPLALQGPCRAAAALPPGPRPPSVRLACRRSPGFSPRASAALPAEAACPPRTPVSVLAVGSEGSADGPWAVGSREHVPRGR